MEMEVQKSGTIDSARLIQLFPNFQYIIPSDLDIIANMLAMRSVAVERNDTGEFQSVGIITGLQSEKSS
jgi:hypothetical protein